MEANYAHQQELDMIPLLMQKEYSAKGGDTPTDCHQHCTLALSLSCGCVFQRIQIDDG
jgi:hypothetical protein